MGCDWSVLSHSNLSAPAAALSLPVSVCLCVSLWPASAASFLLLLLSAPAAAPECTSTRTRCCLSAHTLHTPPLPPSLPPRRKPVPRTATAARCCFCCHQAFLLTFSLPGAADLRVSRSSSTAEKERPPATYHHQRQPTRELQCSPTHNSNLLDTTPPPLTTHIAPPPRSQRACCRATLAAPSVRLHPRCWTVSTSPALDRLPPFSLARASTIDFFDLQCTEKPAR